MSGAVSLLPQEVLLAWVGTILYSPLSDLRAEIVVSV